MPSSPPELESLKFDRYAAEHCTMPVATARPLRHDSKGFTLVELLIVIVILGVLAVVTVFAVRGITDRGQENSEATDLRTLETANEAYYLDYGTNATEQDLLDNGYINELSSMYDMAVDGAGVLTITNVRTGGVAGTALAAGSGGGAGGGGAAGGPVGSLTGLVKNATNEAPISGVSVCVRTTALCTTTGGGGTYTLADVPIGEQTIDFTLAGFTTLDETVTIVDGVTDTQNTAMSPQLAAGELRIVLTWGEFPRDLDSYLWVPGQSDAVFYGDSGSLTSAPFAQLDADDTTGYGPETITISQREAGNYSFGVRSLGGGSFVPAETTVRVYDSGGLVREFTPPSGAGSFWQVFRLDGSSGGITSVNTVGFGDGPF
jgi:prepilin-type N-terminal cleavage/methylation domain-containing protein